MIKIIRRFENVREIPLPQLSRSAIAHRKRDCADYGLPLKRVSDSQRPLRRANSASVFSA